MPLFALIAEKPLNLSETAVFAIIVRSVFGPNTLTSCPATEIRHAAA